MNLRAKSSRSLRMRAEDEKERVEREEANKEREEMLKRLEMGGVI